MEGPADTPPGAERLALEETVPSPGAPEDATLEAAPSQESLASEASSHCRSEGSTGAVLEAEGVLEADEKDAGESNHEVQVGVLPSKPPPPPFRARSLGDGDGSRPCVSR